MKTNLKKIPIHVWHLEILADNNTDREVTAPHTQYDIRKTSTPLPELSRFLYASVGAPWLWYMRLSWNWQQWFDYLSQDSIETWIAYQDATPIGYFELEKQVAGSAEIVYFGLLPEFVGKGLGKLFLEDAINAAWALGENRVWLHTCSLDHPSALPNYLHRGFKVFREEDFEDYVPAQPLQPWEQAAKPTIISGST